MSANRICLFAGVAFIVALLGIDDASAVPSYARQTKLPCSACHTIFPELTSFGRLFKLKAYTLTGVTTIKEKNALELLSISPLSAMIQASFTHVDQTVPGTQNDNFAFPQQLSFFFAGVLTPNLGTFLQVTYEDQGGSFEWDNTDIRAATQTTFGSRTLIYGATLNNNPTVQDVWNSTPAWSFPYASSAVAPTPTAATLIDGPLAQDVLGLGAYGFFDNLIYAEFDIYRSVHQGGPNPPDSSATNTIRDVSPYWRVALQHDWPNQYLEVGTYGLFSKLYPTGVTGYTNNYTDVAIDGQYQLNLGQNNIITAHATWIHETQDLDAFYASHLSENRTNHLDTVRANVNYYYNRRYGGTFALFSTDGDRDTGLYTPQPVFGSRTGKPDSHGFIVQADYLPWLNTRFSVQYVIYRKFNGGEENYDGFGREPSGNNTLYIIAWLNF